ncbi:unnamed protein product, partial [Polarella glacialis]
AKPPAPGAVIAVSAEAGVPDKTPSPSSPDFKKVSTEPESWPPALSSPILVSRELGAAGRPVDPEQVWSKAPKAQTMDPPAPTQKAQAEDKASVPAAPQSAKARVDAPSAGKKSESSSSSGKKSESSSEEESEDAKARKARKSEKQERKKLKALAREKKVRERLRKELLAGAAGGGAATEEME